MRVQVFPKGDLKSWQVFTQTLFYLAAYPQYVEALREEASRVIEEDGWTKKAMNKLRKIDSFIKESHRLTGISTRRCLYLLNCVRN